MEGLQEIVVRESSEDSVSSTRDYLDLRGSDVLSDAFQVLWEKRRELSRCMVLGIFLAFLIVALTPSKYDSTLRLMPPEGRSMLTSGLLGSLPAGADAALGLSGLSPLKSSGALYVDILNSRTVQENLVNRFDLRRVYGVRLAGSARKELSQNTSVKEDAKSGVIAVTVTDRDPLRARDLAMGYVQELDALLTKSNTSAAHRERLFLEERIAQVERELGEASEKLMKFSSNNYAININEQGKAMLEGATNLQAQIIAAQSELSGLQQSYTDSNVRVRSAKARLDELKHQLEAMGGLKIDAKEQPSTDNSLHAVYPSLRKLPELALTFAELQRATKIKEAVFESLTKQLELAKVQEAKETPSVRLLDSPELPERRNQSRLVEMFGYSVLFFLLSTVWVLGRAVWDSINPLNRNKLLIREVFAAIKVSKPLLVIERLRIRFTPLFRRGRNPSAVSSVQE